VLLGRLIVANYRRITRHEPAADDPHKDRT